MIELKLLWTADFRDGSSISQVTPDGQEVLFREVLNRFSDLTSFKLSHINKDLVFKVDLVQGKLYVNNEQQSLGESLVKRSIRLIYFRRHRIVEGQVRSHVMVYFIGFQYLNEKNENCQVQLQLDQEGNILIDR